MPRRLRVAAAQMGPIPDADPRSKTIDRLVDLLESAAAKKADLVVFPEMTLTSFFPHFLIEDRERLLSYYERRMPNPNTQRLFDRAKELGVAFVLGYGEIDERERLFNTASLYGRDGTELLRYRKIHLPGFGAHQTEAEHQLLEKRYFEVGDLGFPAADWDQTKIGLAICNDRRWAETYRALALNGAELICLGYNTPVKTPHLPESDRLVMFHNHLSMQAGAYQNSAWVVGTAKAGAEDGVDQIGGSAIIAPSGEIVACAQTVEDELVDAEIDLDMVTRYRADIFNFSHHRRPEWYADIVKEIPEDQRQHW